MGGFSDTMSSAWLTWQGLDTLAAHLKERSPTRIFLPDVFHGKPFPPDKDGVKEELQKFFAGT